MRAAVAGLCLLALGVASPAAALRITRSTVEAELVRPPVSRLHDRHRAYVAEVTVEGPLADIPDLDTQGLELAGFAEGGEHPLQLGLVIAELVLEPPAEEEATSGWPAALRGTVRLRAPGDGLVLEQPVTVEARFPRGSDETDDDAFRWKVARALTPRLVQAASRAVGERFGWTRRVHQFPLFAARGRHVRGRALRRAVRKARAGLASGSEEALGAARDQWLVSLRRLDPVIDQRQDRLADHLHWNIGIVSTWLRDYDVARVHLYAASGSQRERFRELTTEGMALANELEAAWTAHTAAQASPPDRAGRE